MNKVKIEEVLNDKIKLIEQLRDGFVGDICKVTTDSNVEYVVKEYISKTWKGDLYKEWNALNHLFENGIKVPKPLKYIVEDNSECILMEYVAGEKLLDLFQSNINENYHYKFASLMYDIHTVEISTLQNETSATNSKDFCLEICDYLENRLRNSKMNKYQDTFTWLRENAFNISNIPMCMLHMDFHPGNIIVNNDDFYVLDIVYKIGDYRYDIFWTYNMMRRFDNINIANRFISNYLKITRKQQFCDTDYFNVLTEFSYLINCVTFPVSEPDNINPEAKEFWDGVIKKSEHYIGNIILNHKSR